MRVDGEVPRRGPTPPKPLHAASLLYRATSFVG